MYQKYLKYKALYQRLKTGGNSLYLDKLQQQDQLFKAIFYLNQLTGNTYLTKKKRLKDKNLPFLQHCPTIDDFIKHSYYYLNYLDFVSSETNALEYLTHMIEKTFSITYFMSYVQLLKYLLLHTDGVNSIAPMFTALGEKLSNLDTFRQLYPQSPYLTQVEALLGGSWNAEEDPLVKTYQAQKRFLAEYDTLSKRFMKNFRDDPLPRYARISYDDVVVWSWTHPKVRTLGLAIWFRQILSLRMEALQGYFDSQPYPALKRETSRNIYRFEQVESYLLSLYHLLSKPDFREGLGYSVRVTGGYQAYLLSRQNQKKGVSGLIYPTTDIDFKIQLPPSLYQQFLKDPETSYRIKKEVRDTINRHLQPDHNSYYIECEFKKKGVILDQWRRIGNIPEEKVRLVESMSDKEYESLPEEPLKLNVCYTRCGERKRGTYSHQQSPGFQFNVGDVGFEEKTESRVWLTGVRPEAPMNPKLMIEVPIGLEMETWRKAGALLNITNDFHQRLEDGDIPFPLKLYNWMWQMRVYIDYLKGQIEELKK